MSIIGKMIIDGESFNLLSYHLRFFQEKDIAGRPRGRVNGGLIEVKIEAHRDHIFHHWELEPEQMRDLEIVFSPVAKVSKSRTIQLYDVHCARLAVHFDNYTSNPMTYTILLSPGIFVDGGVVFEKPWKVTDIDAQEVEPTPAPEQEPKVISMFFTDMKNNRIEDVDIDTKVYLHIRSRNMEGRKIDLELHDPEVDFLYEGERLSNDTLREYIINNADERILLEVVAPIQGTDG